MKKIIAILKGGIGNQLFIYANAKALAIRTMSELVIDSKTGFKKDYKYKRVYQLNNFKVSFREANYFERLEPFSIIRKKIIKLLYFNTNLLHHNYIFQNNNELRKDLCNFKKFKSLYIDGYWQSEFYFKDIEKIIRQDISFIPPTDSINIGYATKIKNVNAICIHIRWFDPPSQINKGESANNINKEYYNNAIAYISEKVKDFHYFVFSDYPEETTNVLKLPKEFTTFIDHNKGDENAYADLWLMSLCKHFVIANSTFSWWGAWLSSNPNKIVVAPKQPKNGEGAWGFKGLIPDNWISL